MKRLVASSNPFDNLRTDPRNTGIAMEKLADYITGLLAKLKITRKKVCVLSILVFTVAYILNLGAHAYLSIPNRNLDLELPSFLTFELTFREPVKVLDYRVTRIGAPHPPDSNTNEI